MDLIELHNQRFINIDYCSENIQLIKDNLLRVEHFGRSVHGKHAVNVFLKKGKDTEAIVRFLEQFNRLVKCGAIKNLELKTMTNYSILGKPLFSDVMGIGNFFEPDEPMIVKFICGDYQQHALRKERPSGKLSEDIWVRRNSSGELFRGRSSSPGVYTHG